MKDHHRNETKPGDVGLKLIMTEYELDRWYAYHAGIDIQKFPPYRPAHINKAAYEYLKKYANFNRVEGGNNTSTAAGGQGSGDQGEGLDGEGT